MKGGDWRTHDLKMADQISGCENGSVEIWSAVFPSAIFSVPLCKSSVAFIYRINWHRLKLTFQIIMPYRETNKHCGFEASL